jgi:hypothetical protein
MADELKIKIVADTAQANPQLKATQKELAAIATTAAKADSSLGQLGSSATVALNKTAQASAKSASSIDNLANTAALASTEMGELGDLAQLDGFGMAGLGVVAIAAAKKFFEYITKVKDTVQAQRDLDASLNNSAASVQGNVVRLQALVSIAQDVTKSDNERLEAIGALNKEYDGFNKSLDLSNINTEKSIDLIAKQTKAIVRQAQIKGLENLISKESEKRAEALAGSIEDQLTTFDKVKAAALGAFQGVGAFVGSIAESSIKNLNENLSTSEKRVAIFTDALKKLLGEEAFEGTLFSEKTTKKVVKNLKTVEDKLKDLHVFSNFKLIDVDADQIKKDIDKAFEALGKDKRIQPIKIPFIFDDSDFRKRVETTQKFFADTFSAIGEGIGKSIQDGTSILKGAFEGVLHVMGKFLVQLGEAAVLQSTLAIAIKNAFKNPQLGLVAGIAAIALGSILSSIQLPAFAGGVDNFGGGLALVGERGPEIVNLPRGSDVIPNHRLGDVSGGPIVIIPDTRISGTDIVISYNRQTARNGRNG